MSLQLARAAAFLPEPDTPGDAPIGTRSSSGAGRMGVPPASKSNRGGVRCGVNPLHVTPACHPIRFVTLGPQRGRGPHVTTCTRFLPAVCRGACLTFCTRKRPLGAMPQHARRSPSVCTPRFARLRSLAAGPLAVGPGVSVCVGLRRLHAPGFHSTSPAYECGALPRAPPPHISAPPACTSYIAPVEDGGRARLSPHGPTLPAPGSARSGAWCTRPERLVCANPS